MKQKYTKRPYNDIQSVEFLADKGIPLPLAEMLNARGVTMDNYQEFFSNQLMFHSPFEMPNMAEAAETISYVLEEGGSVLICGDYDADGLTASAVLSLFFTDNGVDNDVIVPTRDEGYGLHAEKVIEAFQNKFYDLVITVDCGISNREEVAKIVDELGVEVIVTDHHELPDLLPDCLCINPKMGYPFPNLSGSGVAWKLVEALAGREVALKYVDVAFIGTIADLMPMEDENRAIVKAGLANFHHKSLKYLAELSKCGSNLSCSDVAMRIGPKINAAGRVGSPEVALKLLLARDRADKATAEELLALNEKRKQILDEIIAQADQMCDGEQIAKDKLVFLYNDNWQHGLLGIAAARYKERYNVPAVVMTLDGDNYVGSARSVDNIHLFDSFNKCKDLLVKFGGHKASVGFSVHKDNLLQLKHALAQIFSQLPQSHFEKTFVYDVELTSDVKVADVYNIAEKLQPLLPQDRIVCRVRDAVAFANTFGKDGAHMSATLKSGFALKSFFKYGEYAPFVKNGGMVDVLCTLDTDSFTKDICGIIEDMTLCNSLCFDEFYRLNLLKNFTTDDVQFACEEQVKQALSQDKVLAIFDDYETFVNYSHQFNFDQFALDVFFVDGRNAKSVVISPLILTDISSFTTVVAFSTKGLPRKFTKNTINFAVECANDGLYKLQLNRDICAQAYSTLKRKTKFDSIKGVYAKYLLGKITYEQFIVALRVFEELDFIKIIDKFTVEFNPTAKSSLENSKIYKLFANLGYYAQRKT